MAWTGRWQRAPITHHHGPSWAWRSTRDAGCRAIRRSANGSKLGDTWEYDPTQPEALRWSQKAANGPPLDQQPSSTPPSWAGHVVRRRAGPGSSPAAQRNVDLERRGRMCEVADVSPGARTGHGMFFDDWTNRVFMFGGQGADGSFLDDTGPITRPWLARLRRTTPRHSPVEPRRRPAIVRTIRWT